MRLKSHGIFLLNYYNPGGSNPASPTVKSPDIGKETVQKSQIYFRITPRIGYTILHVYGLAGARQGLFNDNLLLSRNTVSLYILQPVRLNFLVKFSM